MSQTVTADVWSARFEQEGWATEGPQWLQNARAQAMARFQTLGLPTRRTPSWEHSDTTPLSKQYVKPSAGQLDRAVLERAAFQDEQARIVLVDGAFNAELSDLTKLPEGIEVADLTRVWDAPHFQAPQEAAVPTLDAIGCLNLAFLGGGVFVHIHEGITLEHPIHIVHVHTRPGTSTSTKHVILAGKQSTATIVESWVGSTPGTLTLHTTELIANAGARVDHIKQQLEHVEASHLGRTVATVARDADVRSFLWSSGGAWSRSETMAAMVEPGARCNVDGLWLGRNGQVHDCPTTMLHQAAHTQSDALYKGIMDDASRGIFLGNVIVAKDAQQVDSQQTNRNLLLSDKARVDTTPQLEIYADDVKCAHGSTIGQLDQDALFFLRARGIDKQRGELILTKAFAGEVLERVGSWGIRTRLERRLENWFGGRQ